MDDMFAVEEVFGWFTNEKRKIDLILVSDNLLTLTAFEEMLELHELFFTAVHEVTDLELDQQGELVAAGSGKKSKYKDICLRSGTIQNQYSYKRNSIDHDVSSTFCQALIQSFYFFQCITSAKPIDFIYNSETDGYDLSQFRSDEELVERIQAGTSDKYIYRTRDEGFIDVTRMFRATKPEMVSQDPRTGANNLEQAEVARLIYYQSRGGADYNKWDRNLDVMIKDFNDRAEYI